jgi:hypothetical protein
MTSSHPLTGFSLPAKLPDHPVMTEYDMPPLLQKRRGIDSWFDLVGVLIENVLLLEFNFLNITVLRLN